MISPTVTYSIGNSSLLPCELHVKFYAKYYCKIWDFSLNYPYRLLSDIPLPFISGRLQRSAHKFPCSMNKANNFSSMFSELVPTLLWGWSIDATKALIYLPSATGTRSSMHKENWKQNNASYVWSNCKKNKIKCIDKNGKKPQEHCWFHNI